jgi:hypothetical protein
MLSPSPVPHQGLPLREEKAVVAQIAKLNSQRGKIREFDGQRSTLDALEAECQKVSLVNVSCS